MCRLARTIRITSLGIRGVPHDTVEAAVSMGSTRFQVLANVQLPMARSTIAPPVAANPPV